MNVYFSVLAGWAATVLYIPPDDFKNEMDTSCLWICGVWGINKQMYCMKPRALCPNLCDDTTWYTKRCGATSEHPEWAKFFFFFFGALFLLSMRHMFAQEAFIFFPLVTVRTVRDGISCEHEKQTKLDIFPPAHRLLLHMTSGYWQVLQTRYCMGVKRLRKHFGIDLLFSLLLLLNLQLDSLHLVDDSCRKKETEIQWLFI